MKTSSCACKGIRTCLVCEQTEGMARTKLNSGPPSFRFDLCYKCGELFPSRTRGPQPEGKSPPLVSCSSICEHVVGVLIPNCKKLNSELESRTLEASRIVSDFEGVSVVKDFVSVEEEASIVQAIDSNRWAESQSGRQKQDYGPKVNFKCQKVKHGVFDGFPFYSEFLIDRMNKTVSQLRDFKPVELCNLDYSPARGSGIDPHRDDSWLWGERLVTLNLLSHTVLTFSSSHSQLHGGSVTTVNQAKLPLQISNPLSASRDLVHNSASKPKDDCNLYPITSTSLLPQDSPASPSPPYSQLQGTPTSLLLNSPSSIEVDVPLPSRSLVIVSGPSRHEWLHSIKREYIVARRIAMTFRELTPEFQRGGAGYDSVGHKLLETASNYNGHPINFRS